MATKIVRFSKGQSIRWGIVQNDSVAVFPETFTTTESFMLGGAPKVKDVLSSSTTEQLPLSDIELLCPITENQQLICQGVNYASHIDESGLDSSKKAANVIFRKASSSLCSHNSNIIKPSIVKLLDYEAELGLIIKKSITTAVKVNEQNLHEYIGALVIHNDVSARDIQLTQPTGQFYKGKSFRTFGPTGPYLVLVDKEDVARLGDLEITLEVDDKVRQHSTCKHMVHKPADTLTELSSVQNLFPGDVIATGTPGGVALKAPTNKLLLFIGKIIAEDKKWEIFIKKNLKNPNYLHAGQRIKIRIKTPDGHIDLGEQENSIVDQA